MKARGFLWPAAAIIVIIESTGGFSHPDGSPCIQYKYSFPNRPIPAFCSSDEEDEDPDSLLYLPIAPEIEVKIDKKCSNFKELNFSLYKVTIHNVKNLLLT